MGKVWSDEIFGEIAPEAAEKGQNPTILETNTTHPFGHFHFSGFRETWQEFMNSEILKVFPLRGSLSSEN